MTPRDAARLGGYLAAATVRLSLVVAEHAFWWLEHQLTRRAARSI